jgi:signal transduction histidine kinase
MSVFPVLATVTNFLVIMLCLPRKKSLKFTALVYGSVIAANLAIDFILAGLHIEDPFRGVRALIYLPFVILLFKGLFFQKVFGFFAPLTFTGTLVIPAEMLAKLFMRYGEFYYWLAMLVIPAIILIVYILLVWRFGRGLINRLFSAGTEKEWMLYAFSAVICYFILSAVYPGLAEFNTLALALVLFISWCLIILCFAIINTHEKTRQKYEYELAREIISSGRGYYEKVTEMTEQLSILRHDYKHHLASMQNMVKLGGNAEIQDYLESISADFEEKGVNNYCKSRVINALLDSFSERCKKEKIDFQVRIIPPPAGLVDDYEISIILGNLLENAVTASMRTPENERRYIEISMKPVEERYGIKVENSFDGVLKNEGKTLYTIKKDGGLGIKSIVSVARKYGGEYVPVWDEKKFSAYVILKSEK